MAARASLAGAGTHVRIGTGGTLLAGGRAVGRRKETGDTGLARKGGLVISILARNTNAARSRGRRRRLPQRALSASGVAKSGGKEAIAARKAVGLGRRGVVVTQWAKHAAAVLEVAEDS